MGRDAGLERECVIQMIAHPNDSVTRRVAKADERTRRFVEGEDGGCAMPPGMSATRKPLTAAEIKDRHNTKVRAEHAGKASAATTLADLIDDPIPDIRLIDGVPVFDDEDNDSTANKPGTVGASSGYTSKLAAALDHARAGFSVFPIKPFDPSKYPTKEEAEKKAKTPAIENWQNLATTDHKQIKQWWENDPGRNIGIATGTLLVVDMDPGKGGSVEALKALGELPDTPVSLTQGDGAHFIYRLPEHTFVSNSASKLAPGIDVRSYGGYIVAPGSTIGPRSYRWLGGRSPSSIPVALAPDWLIALCKAPRAKTASAGKRLLEEDGVAVGLAWDWLNSRAPEATAGSRDDTAYKVAARLFDFGVSPDTALDMLRWWNESRCHPWLEDAMVAHAARSASMYRGNAIGSAHPGAPGFEDCSASMLPREPLARALDVRAAPGVPFSTPLLPFDPSAIPPRPWVVPGVACRNTVTMLAGPAGVAKSTYTLMVALATATGRSDICGFSVHRRERVWIWNQEDPADELRRRVAAIMTAFNISWADLQDEHGEPMIRMDSGTDSHLMLATRTIDQSSRGTKQVDQVVDEVKRRKIGLLILDPLAEFHEASENDNVQMRAVVGKVRDIAAQGNCSVILAHHTKKPPKASSDGFAGEMDAARGASAQLGVVRVVLTIFAMSDKMKKDWAVAGSHTDYVRIDIAKNNLAPPRPEPIWFQRNSIMVGGFEGESVGVLRPIDLRRRDAKVGDGPNLLDLIARTISNKLARGEWFKLRQILEHMGEADASAFPAPNHQARMVGIAFDGANECPTDFGKLTRRNQGGNTGWTYSLSSVPLVPQNDHGEQTTH